MFRRLFNWLRQYLQGNSSAIEEFTGGCVSIKQLKKEGVIEDKNQYTSFNGAPSSLGRTP